MPLPLIALVVGIVAAGFLALFILAREERRFQENSNRRYKEWELQQARYAQIKMRIEAVRRGGYD